MNRWVYAWFHLENCPRGGGGGGGGGVSLNVCVQGFIHDFGRERQFQSSVLMWWGCIAHNNSGVGSWGMLPQNFSLKKSMLCD